MTIETPSPTASPLPLTPSSSPTPPSQSAPSVPELQVIQGHRREHELKTLHAVFEFDPDVLLAGLEAMKAANAKKPSLRVVVSALTEPHSCELTDK